MELFVGLLLGLSFAYMEKRNKSSVT